MAFAPQIVVVPVDFSDDSANALRTAIGMTPTPGSLHVIHVLYPLQVISSGASWDEVTDEAREIAAHKQFESFLQANGVRGATTTVRIGDPGLTVADYATEIGADLIVVGTHGYHGLKRFVLGSVAERIIRHADCSVLVVRRKDAE